MRKSICCSILFVLTGSIFLTEPCCKTQRKEASTMGTQLIQMKMLDAVVSAIPTKQCSEQPSKKTLEKASAPQGVTGEGRQWFITMQRNSRQTHSIGHGTWKVKYAKKIDAYLPGAKILMAGNLLVVSGYDSYIKINRGSEAEAPQRTSSAITLTPGGNEIFGFDESRDMQWYQVIGNGKIFRESAGAASFFMFSFVASTEKRIFCCGTAADMARGQGYPPGDYACFLSLTYELPLHTNTDATRGRPLIATNACYQIGSRKVVAASDGKIAVIASPGNIYFMDWAGTLLQRITGSFVPVEMSIDEANRSYMISHDEKKGHELLTITQEGELVSRTVLPRFTTRSGNYFYPPLVGYDHTAYCIAGTTVVGVGSNGLIRYRQEAISPLGGAVVMSNNHLLVAEGTVLSEWDLTGERKIVWSFGDETVMSSPFISQNGEVYISTNSNFYCLELKE